MNKHENEPAQERIDGLERRVRKLHAATVASLALLLVALCAPLIGRAYADASKPPHDRARNATFHTITVDRINVVAPDGTRRLVIANAKDMPPPILDGKRFKRAISPAGITFYNEHGDERGGIGLAPRNGGEQSALVFDYDRGDGVGLVRSQNKAHTTAGLVILNPPPAGEYGHGGDARLQMQLADGTSQIVMRDGQGRPRLRFTVPEHGQASIAFLDKNGKVTREISSGDSTAAQ